MGSLITEIFSAFTTTIEGMTSGIKSAFMNFLYVDPTAETLVVSDVSKFMFLMLGLSLALGVVATIVKLVRNRG